MDKDLVFEIYKDQRTVFRLQEIAILLHEPDFSKLKQRVHYYVKTDKIKNPRRGIYVKKDYLFEELACKIYIPAYISLEYVLQKAGIIFQYSQKITMLSYLSRSIQVDGKQIHYRKIKNDVLININGITRDSNGINIATPERAFLDILYLNKECYFDTVKSLNKDIINDLIPMYKSNELKKRVYRYL